MGLTKNERGIPYRYLRKILEAHKCEIINVSYHYFMYSFLVQLFNNASFLRSKLT